MSTSEIYTRLLADMNCRFDHRRTFATRVAFMIRYLRDWLQTLVWLALFLVLYWLASLVFPLESQ